MNVRNLALKYSDEVVKNRRHFHMYPELSGQEFETSKFVQNYLDELGIPYEIFHGTGVIGTIEGDTPGKTVLLRADMDALEVTEKNDVEYKSRHEGVMHACGHDGHTAMLLGAAKILMEVKDQLKGTVKLLFQPAEEIAMGAKAAIDETNIINEIDAAFGIHLWQGVEAGKVSIEAGPRMAAADLFSIKVTGKSCHASMPQEGIDATVAASAIIMNLQSLVSRNTSPNEGLVVTIGKMTSGTRFNIVSGSALLEGTSRSFHPEVWAKIPEQLERVAKNTAEAYGATAEVEINRATPALWNDPNISAILHESMTKMYGEGSITKFEKTTGGEDFAYFTQEVPGALAFVGIRNDVRGINASHHNECFDMDEKGLEIGTALYAQFALDYLAQ